MLFELRQYRTRPGQRDRWVRFMEEEIIPFQVSKGMVIVGSFTDEEDEDAYVWIRRFDDEAARERLYTDVYKSAHWTDVIGPQIPDMLIREEIRVRRLVPTPRSVIR